MGLEGVELVLGKHTVDLIADLLDTLVLVRLVLPESDYYFSLDTNQQSVDEVCISLDCVEVEKSECNCISKR